MLHHIAAHAFEIKLFLGTLVAVITAVTDAITDIKGWEDISLKALLIAALIFVVRLLLKQQETHKLDQEKAWEMHKKDAEIREIKYCTALDKNSECVAELVNLTKEQTDYFKTVTRNIVNEKFGPRAPLP